ncbi:uncharacterized protein LOC133538652 isoform X1 [Nerophis ophidion]|uniref:uncharacterized protein LOC133538652 isoform X1 n=1 Tax=Nerophis ophidion TaxID=159077 RepID=UPI002ADF8C42|nr:uncharacterized protein LOC133538652 isoform X1 [Nerophis ophidion]
MKSLYIFLLLYFLWGCVVPSSQQRCRDETCNSTGTCSVPDAASGFLQCVGLPASDTGRDHLQNVKGMLEAAMDMFTFMRSSAERVPLFHLLANMTLDPEADPLHNEALVKMWLEVKMKPLLKSINRHMLACLSTKNFSCSAYQTVVKELSHHFSEMIPERQQWVYSFFMYPFLSGNGVAGCVHPNESSEDWLLKNFGAFSVMARMNDLSTINIIFDGLEVLNLLSPQQKAELLLRPEVGGLSNGSLHLVFHSLMADGPLGNYGGNHNRTGPGHSYSPPPTDSPYLPASPHNSLGEVITGIMTAVKPIGSFVHDFVWFTKQRNVSEIRGSTMMQFFLNWTLAEMASIYKPRDHPPPPQPLYPVETPECNTTEMEDWYLRVVMPVLRRFSKDDQSLRSPRLKLAFCYMYKMDHHIDYEIDEVQDVCSVTLNGNPCGMTDAVENVAHIMHCAAKTNLTLTEGNIMRLIWELTNRLNLLINEFATANFTEVSYDFRHIFEESNAVMENLEDPEFITMWFYVKLMPLLPKIPNDLLFCLSNKNFSCPAYQTIVALLSQHMSDWDFNSVYIEYHSDLEYYQNVYSTFIYRFIKRSSGLHHNMSDVCFSANNSRDWLSKNFGSFSQFPNVTDFYDLNQYFSGLDVLDLLSQLQVAQMIILPLPTPPEKEVVIKEVFDFLLEYPRERKLVYVIGLMTWLAYTTNPPCTTYLAVLERLQSIMGSVPPDLEPQIRHAVDTFIRLAPQDCLPQEILCNLNIVNATDVCKGINSSELQLHFDTSSDVPCIFTLEEYACAKLPNFTASQLASLMSCGGSNVSKHSVTLWKIVLTKHNAVLDPALDILADKPVNEVVGSMSAILDVIGEIRLALLSDEQLNNSTVIAKWFSRRLARFLPMASPTFLRCLSLRNFSCQAYQQILQAFVQTFNSLDSFFDRLVLEEFIKRFLSRPHSGPGCLSGYNSSAEWLMNNVGPYSQYWSLQEILMLNPEFDPLEALPLLTSTQRVQLLFLKLPGLPEQGVILNQLFDQLTESPEEQKNIPEFLARLLDYLDQDSNGNFSCSSYKTLFARLDLAVVKVPLNVASIITDRKRELSKLIPPGCIIYSSECHVTSSNETEICMGVNSTALQLHLENNTLEGRFCDFAVEEFACASLTLLTAQDLAMILNCNRSANASGSTPIWKLLLSKTSHVLNQSLELLANMTYDPQNPASSVILDAIGEVRLNLFPDSFINDPAFIQLWFNRTLRPFLPAVSSNFLSCLTTKNLTCNTYQQIVQTLSLVKPDMSITVQARVLSHFIKVFLTRNDTADPSCSSHSDNSGEWLQQNLGAFSHLVLFSELQMLHSNFTPMEALPYLTIRQLADVASSPGQLVSPAMVDILMQHVPDHFLANFFDDFSPSITSHQEVIPAPVRSAMLEVVFNRANLSHSSVNDSVVSVWLRSRLGPLLFNMSHQHVSPFFEILAGRNCSLEQEGVMNLNMFIPSLTAVTHKEIHNHIIQALQEPTPLRCYINGHSYYDFLQSWFLGFQLPNLTTFLSLMPEDRMKQLVNSMSPMELGDYLRLPDIVDDNTTLCSIFSIYHLTPSFVELEMLPEAVREPMLPCLWPIALSNTTRSEVNAWFDQRLRNYLGFLTKNLLRSNDTYNATCVAFQKLVSVLGNFRYAGVDFARRDVYDTITTYLNSATEPRCYDASDPELNSTAWFADYIGPFIDFISLHDLLFTFGSAEVLQVFTVDLRNIAIFNQTAVPVNVTSYYTELLYNQDNNFNPLLLPLLFRCFAPGTAFSQLSADESMIVLHNLTTLCTNLDPQVSSALASNFGNTIDASAIAALGSESVGMSEGQLQTIKPEDLHASLDTLANVSDWNEGQAKAIILSLISSGLIQINNASSLFELGSLIIGVPANIFINISSSQLINASQNPSFLSHLLTASPIIRQVFVSQIILLNSNSDVIIKNVPDDLATEIPPTLLLGFSSNENIIGELNRKKWRRTQAELFFEVVAILTATEMLGSPDNLSSSVLQGFTCTAVRTFQKSQVIALIKACRRRGTNKVTLVETQLTCMYNHIRQEADVTSFDLYPPDVLLYYDYSLVPLASCKSYFEELSEADFSVFSPELRYKRNELFSNARSCLAITSTSLTKDHISVLGNMCCILDGSYISTSDSSILDKLQQCSDLTADQAAAVETLLQSGNTPLGPPSTWTKATLEDLGLLPLFLTSNFYKNFDKSTKRSFLKDFLKALRRMRVDRQKLKSLKTAIRMSNQNKVKRSVANECTVGNITQVTIAEETFPFDYDDINQFNCCLSADTVRGNLAAITDKVDQDEYLQIVLEKLREAYANQAAIPENQVDVLGSASRQATITDINMWTITLIDTLSSLMDSSNGPWDPNLAKEIISKYLRQDGNTLGTAELNAVGGDNLCSLDTSVLQSISPQSLRNASTLIISSCTLEKKQALFIIAREAFGETTTRSTVSISEYKLVQPYLGGAPLDYLRSLLTSDVNMDVETFISLNPSVVLALSVEDVRALLNANLPELKSYESQALVQEWIQNQRQSELDTLGVGLQGGKADPTSAPRPPVTPGSGTGSTTASPTPSNASGGRLRADPGRLFLLVLGLLMASVHVGQ